MCRPPQVRLRNCILWLTLLFSGLLGTSHAMRELFEAMERAANSDAPLVLCGETGSGKQRVARAIHAASERAKGPFVFVQCATVAPAALPSEWRDDNTALSVSSNLDQAFAEVVAACAEPRAGASGTWITPEMLEEALKQSFQGKRLDEARLVLEKAATIPLFERAT